MLSETSKRAMLEEISRWSGDTPIGPDEFIQAEFSDYLKEIEGKRTPGRTLWSKLNRMVENGVLTKRFGVIDGRRVAIYRQGKVENGNS